MQFKIEKIIIDDRVVEDALTLQVSSRLPDADVKIIHHKELAQELESITLTEGKRILLITRRSGELVKPCPATNPPYLCCRYTVINQAWQCPMDCTYCVLQGYLGKSVMTVFSDTDVIHSQIIALLESEPRRFFRFGTGELADSLALDPLTDQAAQWINFFYNRPNTLIELKTKSDNIDGALKAAPSNAVLAWSVNPKQLIDKEELHAASLEARLVAAKRAQEAGFMLAFHFDPMVLFPGWEQAYRNVVQQIFSTVDSKRIIWISLGAFRFPPSFDDVIRQRFPGSGILNAEMIRGLDGKMRYIRPLREKLFKTVVDEIRKYDKNLFLYFCMEAPWMWDRILGWTPDNNGHLDYHFALSVKKRFPQIDMSTPDIADYFD
ncbi:DNA photolyase [bacterium]|nr:DNA photolyase [bacterium]